jgi:hypothetical protein
MYLIRKKKKFLFSVSAFFSQLKFQSDFCGKNFKPKQVHFPLFSALQWGMLSLSLSLSFSLSLSLYLSL